MYLSPNPKQLFKLKCIVCSAFWKANILKVELSMIKIGELLRRLWSLRSCFNILPTGSLTPQGIEGAMKRDVSKHWCTLQWYASRGWFMAHENWMSWYVLPFLLLCAVCSMHIIGNFNSMYVKIWHIFRWLHTLVWWNNPYRVLWLIYK